MLNSKRLLVMLRKWQTMAMVGRRRIMSATTDDIPHQDNSIPSVVIKGHLFVFSTDGKRFMIPLLYLTNRLFRELFRMSEEEFGLPTDGPITLPCDASCMEYIISILRYGAFIDVERAVLASIAGDICLVSSLPQQGVGQAQLICGF